MKWFLHLWIVLLTSCCTHAPTSTPIQRRAWEVKHRPVNMLTDMTYIQVIPDWVIMSYAQWIRYAHDLEAPGYGQKK